mmetsp:Transcript_57516/g.182187  ORF Transcript_57516/g.182187 Transcript_57516/m.182187 type:complete len:242 (-) Transcript_57516:574-1299(-)
MRAARRARSACMASWRSLLSAAAASCTSAPSSPPPRAHQWVSAACTCPRSPASTALRRSERIVAATCARAVTSPTSPALSAATSAASRIASSPRRAARSRARASPRFSREASFASTLRRSSWSSPERMWASMAPVRSSSTPVHSSSGTASHTSRSDRPPICLSSGFPRRSRTLRLKRYAHSVGKSRSLFFSRISDWRLPRAPISAGSRCSNGRGHTGVKGVAGIAPHRIHALDTPLHDARS